MSALAQAAQDYLQLRRSLGHDLTEAHRLLPRFVAYLDSIGAPTVTINATLAWVYEAGVDPTSSNPARRMSIARGFARHMASRDPRTQVPPLGVVPNRQRWRPPFIYSQADVSLLMAQARRMRWRLPAVTHSTLIGLLAATGMRVGEAWRLDRPDVDWDEGVLVIRKSKFNLCGNRHNPNYVAFRIMLRRLRTVGPPRRRAWSPSRHNSAPYKRSRKVSSSSEAR